MAMDKVCLDCGKKLNGRSDKKFCDDQCRSNYNTHRKTGDPLAVRTINNILKKNRRVMEQLINAEGKIKLKREAFTRKGFDFNYHTHTYNTLKGTTYLFCYEYGYLPLEDDELLLVKQAGKMLTND